MTLLYTDAVFLEHQTPAGHPECVERLRAIHARLEQAGLLAACTSGSFAPLPEHALPHVHSPQMIAAAKRMCGDGGGYLDADTPVVPASFAVSLSAAGACVAAVEDVLAGKDKTALCLVRPPGHHATPSHSMGFCLFNNIALAADHARRTHGLSRILIVDWDVHHGNGTQDIFFADDAIFFLSTHRFPFYPGTGRGDETGTGRGLGYTLNVPLRFGVSRKDFVDAFTRGLHAAADKMKPELVLISAGFDAHAEDPIGSLGLECEDFSTLTERVREVANTHAGGRVVSCLEGGYHLERLAESVEAHLGKLVKS
jgi:acetoin utilization deacetylase AcuC-like enzyme